MVSCPHVDLARLGGGMFGVHALARLLPHVVATGVVSISSEFLSSRGAVLRSASTFLQPALFHFEPVWVLF